MSKKQEKNAFYSLPSRRGFTLIESVVLLFIFTLVSVVFLQVYVVGSRIIIDSKNRLGAVALANQKMEIVRSIEYEDIGTKTWNGSAWVYGIPGGDLLQEEDISINTRRYHVSTFVQYVDDALDNKSPTDTIPTDYKRVRVQVSWGNADSERAVLFGTFTPNGLETAVAGGTLSLNVLHTDGSGVAGANVNVRNSSGSINVNGVTDATGNLSLPGTPASSQGYTITVSKSGYYGANTYPPYPTTSYNPVNIHASVVINTLNQFSIVMDEAVTLPLKTVDPYDQAIPSINFSFSGGRILGTIPTSGVSVVTVNDTSRNTDAEGKYTYQSQSYGLYNFALGTSSAANYELYKILPETSTTPGRIDADPGSTQEFKVVLLSKAFASLKVTVLDTATTSPLAGATVRLRNGDSSYDVNGTTDQYGFAFFPTSITPLVAGDYTLTVNASGHSEKSSAVSIGTGLVKQTVNLNAN
jgi:type II secretory pathway pseudopilin PulG